jgi:hypothetical protein
MAKLPFPEAVPQDKIDPKRHKARIIEVALRQLGVGYSTKSIMYQHLLSLSLEEVKLILKW